MVSKFEEVLQRAERLIQSCEGSWPPEGEPWPPERPPTAPKPVFGEAQGAHPVSFSPWSPSSPPERPREPVALPTEPVARDLRAGARFEAEDLRQSESGEAGTSFGPGAGHCKQTPSGVMGTSSFGPATNGGYAAPAFGTPLGGPKLGGDPAILLSNIAGFRPSETAVMVDGLERENALLRLQIERGAARERALKAELDELKHYLELQERKHKEEKEALSETMAAESERFRAAIARQGSVAEAVAARLEVLQGEHESQEAQLSAVGAELANAQAEILALVKGIEQVQRFVLPNTPVELHGEEETSPPSRGRSPLQVGLHNARQALKQLKLACEAKFETFGLVHQQLRARLEAAVVAAAAPSSPTSGEGQPPAATNGTAKRPPEPRPEEEELRQLRSQATTAVEAAERLQQELREVKATNLQIFTQLEQATKRLGQEEEERFHALKELDGLRRSLRVKEEEVKELHLLSKYFSGRELPPTPHELGAAELAEELRQRCSKLSEEVKALRAERDYLLVEKDRAERRAPGSAPGPEAMDQILVRRALEQRRATVAGGLSGVPGIGPLRRPVPQH